jgi:hypothetical protein
MKGVPWKTNLISRPDEESVCVTKSFADAKQVVGDAFP